MSVDTLSEQSRLLFRIDTVDVTWGIVKLPENEQSGWLDDQYDYGYGPDEEPSDDDGWMDDMDEAA
jgi:hypothetical protein